jgi:4-amino-4-deoxy-L-arabinose transferase-like glycosyltransferase
MALAFISKGPVALVQTIIPFILFFMVRQRSDKKAWPRRWLGPAIFGALVFALVAFPWFLYVAARSEAWATWRIEVLRKDPLVPSSNPFNYLTIFVLMLPWSAFFVVGLIRALGEAGQRPLPRMTYALFLLLAPILVMTFFRDRKERYLLPMVPAAAILTAHGLLALRDQVLAQRIRLPLIVHWVIVAGLGVVVPLMAAMKRIPGMLTVDGQAWFSWPLAGGLAVGCGALVAVGAYLGRGRIWGVIAPTVVVMLLMNPALMWAYGRSEAGRSEMKEFAFGIRQRYPVIPAYSIRAGRRPPEELSIYMNRTVQALADLSKLPPPAGPQLLFVFEDKKTAAPALPPYWVPVDSYRRGESVWQVYHHP